MDVVESPKEQHYQNASLEEIRQLKTRKRCRLGAVDSEVRKAKLWQFNLADMILRCSCC
jgi:hypothetical protein